MKKSNLIKYLEIEKRSFKEVGKIYGVVKDTVKHAALVLGIDVSSQIRESNINWNKEELERLLFEEHLTTGDIAKLYGVSDHSVVLRALKRLGIDTKNLPSKFLKIDKNELLDLVFNKKLSKSELAIRYNTTEQNIN